MDKTKNPQAAADYATKNAKEKSVGLCAKYVANALINKGNFTFDRQPSAYMYHTKGILTGLGFQEIQGGNPMKGDIYVQEGTKTHPDGHIAIYNGSNWISDFKQKTDNVYQKDAGAKHYYRYSAKP